MGIYVIPFLEVFHDILKAWVLPLCHKFIIAAPGADCGLCGHENLHLCVRKNSGADIPAVHNDTAALRECVEVVIHPGPHERNGADRAHKCAHFQSADLLFYTAGAAVEERLVILPPEMKVQARQGLLKGVFIYFSFRSHAILHGKEGYAAVHCAAVQIQEAEFLGNHLCECAFAG